MRAGVRIQERHIVSRQAHTDLHPGVDWERRAWVIGTALDVWQIVDAHRDISSIERMTEDDSANRRQIQLALDYYELFPEEIDAAIAENRRPIEQLEAEFPS